MREDQAQNQPSFDYAEHPQTTNQHSTIAQTSEHRPLLANKRQECLDSPERKDSYFVP